MSLDVWITAMQETEVYSANITHNLGGMARLAGLYEALWRPEEINVTSAGELVPFLVNGLNALEGDPEKFRALNPENGWGDYDGLVRFVKAYLDACLLTPHGTIGISR